jgi:hypothetical protein
MGEITKILYLIERILNDSIENENIVNIDKLDELYKKMREIVEDKNNIYNKWYDKKYEKNIIDMNININKFAKLTKDNSNVILKMTYK